MLCYLIRCINVGSPWNWKASRGLESEMCFLRDGIGWFLCIFKLELAPYLPVEKHWKNRFVWKGPLEVGSVHWTAAPTAAIAALSSELYFFNESCSLNTTEAVKSFHKCFYLCFSLNRCVYGSFFYISLWIHFFVLVFKPRLCLSLALDLAHVAFAQFWFFTCSGFPGLQRLGMLAGLPQGQGAPEARRRGVPLTEVSAADTSPTPEHCRVLGAGQSTQSTGQSRSAWESLKVR